MQAKTKERLMRTLSMTVAIYRHGDSQRSRRWARLIRHRIVFRRVDSAFNAAQSSHAKKKTSRRLHRTCGSALMTWHGFAPNSRASSMDAPLQLSYCGVQQVASLLQKDASPQKFAPFQSAQESRLDNSRVFIPKEAALRKLQL